MDLDVRGMRDGDELHAIEEQRFLELVRDAQLVASVAGASRSPAMRTYSSGSGVLRAPGASQ